MTIDWPPTYTIKRHRLTRTPKLKASGAKGLELILPTRFSLKHVPTLLKENREWIEKQLKKIAAEQKIKTSAELPEKIILPAINATWKVDYISCPSRLKLMSRPHVHELVLFGDVTDQAACKALLTEWIKRQAKLHLPKQLAALSKKLQMPYTKITIRDQQTRLGSCTADKAISLNYRLLLIAENLAAHIIIHELCHTVHLDHSENFWRLVEKHDPDWQVNRKLTRRIDELLPEWLL